MNKPKIEILLAVYNGEPYLPALLDSLVGQTYRDFRLIVSDNKSTDSTVAILNDYSARFAHDILILPAPPKTVSAHLNFARVSEAGGAPYLMFADCNDVWHSNKVERTLASMQDAEERYGATYPILVHSDLVVVDKKLNRLHPSFWGYQHVNPRRTGLNQLLLQNCVTGCAMMLNRPLFEMGRPIPEEARVHDYWYALIASAFGHIESIEEPLIEYRQHGGNVTGAKSWSALFVIERALRALSKDGARSSLQNNMQRSKAFLVRFGDQLSQSQKEMVEAFASLPETGALSRRRQLLRYGFWKFGLVRNIGLFLII